MTFTAKPDAATVAAVFPPWWGQHQTLNAAASAGASIVRTGGLSSIVIVQPAPQGGTERLRRAGAWFALDPLALDACFSSFTSNDSKKARPS